MKIQTIPISQVSPASYNPRIDLKPGDSEYEKLKSSLDEFGCVQLLVWNERTGNLVGGHQRLSILRAGGVTEVEVSVVDLSLEKEKALNLALNKIQGWWDEEKLAALLQELSQIPEFDVGLTGFETPEMNQLFDAYLAPDLDDDKESSELEGPAITQRGDLIHLGPHRLLCGDSTSIEDLEFLMGDKKINLWHTDFPYGVAYSSDQRPTNKGDISKWKKIENDDLNPEEYAGFLKKATRSLCPFLISGAAGYLWNGFLKMGCLNDCLEEEGFHVSSLIVWVKPTPSPSFADYQWQSEFCAYIWRAGESHKWFGPSTETNVWESPRDPASKLIHPTQKPVSLAQRAIKNSSERGDIVFDGFAGSGSSMIAAHSLERICYAMELEPSYCDAIVRRYIKTFGPNSVITDILAKYGS